MQDTSFLLIGKILRSYVVMGLTLYLVIFLYWVDSFNYYNILNVISLLTYSYLLWTCVDKGEDYFTSRRLWLTTFLYSIVFVGLYLQMSYFYSGNTLLFSELDAKAYARLSEKMKDMDFFEAQTFISHIWGYDDWGAPMTLAFIRKFLPYKIFVNFCYILMNSACALCMFSIGCSLKMSKKYAYMSALSYAIASYSIFFMSSFLKEEILCLLVVASFYFLYQYKQKLNLLYLAAGGITSLLIVYFRVPVALFLWLSYAVLLLMDNKNHIRQALFIMFFAIVSISAVGLVFYSSTRYANGGNLTSSYQYLTTSLFQKAVSSFGALVGPFPTIFQISTVPFSSKPMYGAGLLFKFLLFWPFWKGLALCLKTKIVDLYPLYLFTIMEMVGLCLTFDGLELRKAMPHVAIYILVAFWYMDKFDKDTDENIRATPYYYWTYRGLDISVIVVSVVSLAWNVLLRIEGVKHIFLFSTDQ